MSGKDTKNREPAETLPGPAPTQDRASGPTGARISVEDLLQGAREMILVHDGQDYRLRVTSKGKLILTK